MHAPSSFAPRKIAPFIRVSILFLSLVGIIIFAHAFELQGLLDPDWADAHLKQQGEAGILLYLVLAALLSALGMPRQAISALGGYAFGALAGILWTSMGVTLGCICAFFYSRLLGRTAIQRRFGRRIARLDAFLARNPVLMTIALRLFPFSSNGLTNMAAGVTAIPAPSFIIGSAIGYLPQTIIFSLLGSGIRVDPLWRTSLSAALFAFASLIGFYLFKRYRVEHGLHDEQKCVSGAEYRQHEERYHASAPPLNRPETSLSPTETKKNSRSSHSADGKDRLAP